MENGISIRGMGPQTISKELYQETIILSDMYDLNEFAALDLLCTAQLQLPYYPGLPRGLIAVLLYYDGRKALLSTLRMLVHARKGTFIYFIRKIFFCLCISIWSKRSFTYKIKNIGPSTMPPGTPVTTFVLIFCYLLSFTYWIDSF